MLQKRVADLCLVFNHRSLKFIQILIIKKPEAHGPQRLPECIAMKAIFSQNTVNVACKKNEPFVCN